MSEEAFRTYEQALKEQHTRNEARRIRTRVNEARRNPHPAGLRWPFELLQNALDAGPRAGRASVTVRLHREASSVTFEHDGALFNSQELAALLSGGSSKEFESEVTTGRFGTGFLVTHVLAERTRLRGLLEVPSGCEQFDLTLDRGGDEEAILENIRASNESIRAAVPVVEADGAASAVFEYPISDDSSLGVGLEALRRALPYLYGTRQSLGRVQISTDGGRREVWEPAAVERQAIEGGYADRRAVAVTSDRVTLHDMQVLRFMTREDAPASALVLLERTPRGWKVRTPDAEAPRVYREYPLRGSAFLPVNIVFDGKFDPDQERSRLLMSPEDKALLEEAFAAAVLAVQHAFEQRWEDAHLLARAWPPTSGFDATDTDEKSWWSQQLATFAERLASLPIVETTSEFLPAISSDGPYADFVIPRLLAAKGRDETTVDRIWHLVDGATDLFPPRKELAHDWTDIAAGWQALGLDLGLVTVDTLAEHVRGDAKMLAELRVKDDPQEWLAEFFDVVGECWSKRGGTDVSVLGGIVPNQNRQLCSPADLRRDGGVSERLKAICTSMGYDVRAELFLDGFEDIARSAGLTNLTKMIAAAIPAKVTEGEVVTEVVRRLGERLPEDEDCDEDSSTLEQATVRLLAYLWESLGTEAASTARQVPLIASSSRVVRWSHERMLMAPVGAWPETAQPFAHAYPPDRILHGRYAGSADQAVPDVVEALVKWGMALEDPITEDTPAELKERRLSAISSVQTDGVVVSGETFSQIALLQPVVLNRCQEGTEEARALLGLVLCHVAPHDASWKEDRIVKGRRAKEPIELPVRGALWLADLKFRAWVPVPGEDGKPVKMVANAATLRDLLVPSWLEGNDAAIKLLSEWFEFDELDLRLMGIAPDEERRRELRNGLARLVETGGGDPQFYASLAEEVELRRRRSRDVERCRRLGFAVQEAIRDAMESHKLQLKLIDKGFDYEVTLPADDAIEDAASVFEVGPYLLEVKATTTGQARLTPTQAETASREAARYVLCVVDLRQLSDADLEAEWTADRVIPLAKIIDDIGGTVEQTCQWVHAARTSVIGIRNEAALRYEVPAGVWASGMSIASWVGTVLRSAAPSERKDTTS